MAPIFPKGSLQLHIGKPAQTHGDFVGTVNRGRLGTIGVYWATLGCPGSVKEADWERWIAARYVRRFPSPCSSVSMYYILWFWYVIQTMDPCYGP